MADETLLLELDIGGDSGDAQQSITDVADALGGMQTAIDSINDANLEQLGQAGQDAAAGTEAAAVGSEDAAAGAEQAGAAAEGTAGSFDALSTTAGALGNALAGIGFGDLVSGAEELGGALTSMGEEGMGALDATALGVGVLGAVGVGTFAALGAEAGSWATDMMRLEAITGLNQEAAERWSAAMEIVGGNQASLERASIRLSGALKKEHEADVELAEAAVKRAEGDEKAAVKLEDLANKAGPAANALRQLGIASSDEAGNVRSFGDVFPELLQKLGAMQNKTEMVALAGDIFGKRFAGSLIPLIENYGQVMGNAADITGQFGIKGDDASQMAIDFNTNMTALKLQLTAIAVSVLPSFIAALAGVSVAFAEVVNVGGPIVQFFKDHEEATVALAAVIGMALVAALIAATIAAWNLAAAMMATGIPEVAAAVAILAVGLYELYVHWDDLIRIVKDATDWFKNADTWVKILAIGLGLLALPLIALVAPFVITGIAIVAAIKYFGDLVSAGQAVIDFFSSLPDAFNSVIAAIVGFGDSIVGAFNSIIAAISGVGDSIASAVETGVAAIVSAVDAVGNAVQTVIDTITSIPGAVMGLLIEFFDWFKAHWYDLLLWMVRIFVPILGLSYLIIQFRNEIAAAFTTAFDAIKGVIVTGVTGVVDAFRSLPDGLYDIWANTLAPFLVSLPGSIFEALAATPGLLIQLGSAAFNALADGIYGVWVGTLAPFLVSVPGAIFGALTALAGNLAQLGFSAFHALADGLYGVWVNTIAPFISSVPGAFLSAFSGLAGAMYNVGAATFSGLYDGLSGWWNVVWGFVVSLPGRIIQFFKDVLGIGSPSSVFYDIGSNLMMGLLGGMTSVLSHPENLPGYLLDILKNIPGVGDILKGIGDIIGSVSPFQFGGIVTQPTLALLGEAGPEAVVPLSRPASALARGGTTVISVHFSHEGLLMGDEIEARRFGGMIATMVRSEWERLHSR